MTRACTLILLLWFAIAANAAELREITVEHEKGVYTMNSVVWFDAPIDDMYEVFSKWDYSVDFSSAIVEARDLEADELGRPQYFTRLKGCILFFCMDFVRQGYAELEPNKTLKAFADPETSDFNVANETWTFSEEDGGTVVVYDLTMDPKFWVPPAIGPAFIKRKLSKDGTRALGRIEKIAQDLADE